MPSPLLQLPNTYRAFYGGFAQLHAIQKEAIAPILEGRDLVLQSATGSGKTEAVLAPCIERVIRSKGEAAVLYLVPTRALALDLERRLSPIISGRLGLGFGVRTGDVKRAGGSRPDVVLTTPESLDVLMGSAASEWQHFLRRVRMLVIDEVHPLLQQPRGAQLALLLRRLERRTGGAVQRMALSATIADVEAILTGFGFRADAVRLMSTVQREIVPYLVQLKREETELVALLDDLYDRWGYRKILLFANSRGQCDRLFALAGSRGRFRGVAALHYSNLKPRERRAVEERFRRREHALCIATSTLELGIDIGDVDGVLLFEPPDSVSAFLQRIGRSNRRESRTHFWGICRGALPGLQLLRFLALLRLARQGIVEAPLGNRYPSVFAQQVLSCLYEKKSISLAAMQALFPERAAELAPIFASMERQSWLRPVEAASPASHTSGGLRVLYRGGWRYRDALLERAIWSNFPEAEEDYSLEVAGEAVADLPKSIVRQLDPGDRVQLAGRRIRVLQIDEAGERKRLIAEPTETLDDKELVWLGTGFQVSFEVARAMRDMLQTSEAPTEELGLFARTQRLLDAERKANSRVVTLKNGIEVLREPNEFFRYRTFLGSMGNLVLRLTIARQMGGTEDLSVSSDEIGLTCSHWVDFQRLPLPVERFQWLRWVAEHLRSLRFLLPLNAYARVLPDALVVEEITGYIFDPRVAERFALALAEPSEVASGDPRLLEVPEEAPVVREGPRVLQSSATGPLLEEEKARWSATETPEAEIAADARHIPRPLTGTMVGEYLRHQQCERWLSQHFLPAGQQLRAKAAPEAALEAARTARGREHEAQVLSHLQESGAKLHSIDPSTIDAPHASRAHRFQATGALLEDLLAQTAASSQDTFGLVYLVHGVLHAPSLLQDQIDPKLLGLDMAVSANALDQSLVTPIAGVGIPDLIGVLASSQGVVLEVGDIKDSRRPHMSQKWQVAFYALLLKSCLRQWGLPARLSDTGFLILRPSPAQPEPLRHPFDLKPFLAAFPALFNNMARVLLTPPAMASCRLQEHCTTCPFFNFCYRQALREEDIQFIPQLSAGILWKLRQSGGL